MKTIFCNNFQEEIFLLLKDYDAKEFKLMISGGSLLAVLNYPPYEILNSTKWEIYYADERVDTKGSNYTGSLPFLKMLKGKVYKMDVNKSPEEYSRILPKIDVCLLGVGPDGHICSLFPDTPSLDSTERVIAVVNQAIAFPERITTTIKFLNEDVGVLYFVIPPKDGKVKEVKEPHESIRKRLTKEYTTILYKEE